MGTIPRGTMRAGRHIVKRERRAANSPKKIKKKVTREELAMNRGRRPVRSTKKYANTSPPSLNNPTCKLVIARTKKIYTPKNYMLYPKRSALLTTYNQNLPSRAQNVRVFSLQVCEGECFRLRAKQMKMTKSLAFSTLPPQPRRAGRAPRLACVPLGAVVQNDGK